MFKQLVFLIPIGLLLLCSNVAFSQSLAISRNFINIESAQTNQPSGIDTFSLTMSNFSGDLRMVTSFPFQLSNDGISFNDTLIIDNSLSNTNVVVYTRFVPNQADIVYREPIAFQDSIFTVNQKVYLIGNSISPTQSLSVCSWNMKWFGLPTQCNCDTALSLKNATNLIKEINADVYAIQEMVSIDHLQRVVQSLGQDYTYIVSDYCSQITNSSLMGYTNCQKLAYIYNKQKVSNEGSYGLLRSTYPSQSGNGSPYYYFASGRWPLVFKAKVINSLSNQEFVLVNIHGKAYSGTTDHNRRAGAAVKMTDSLNALYPNEKVVVFGDYNDLIEGAITTGFTVSPYDYLMNNGYIGITLPSLFPGEVTYIASPGSLIDNLVVSSEAYPAVIPNSTTILREADFAIDNFKSTTSDHLPVLTYLRTNTATSTNDVLKEKKLFSIINPSSQLQLTVPNQFVNSTTKISIRNLIGEVLFANEYIRVNNIIEEVPNVSSGVYLIQIQNETHSEVHKWLVP